MPETLAADFLEDSVADPVEESAGPRAFVPGIGTVEAYVRVDVLRRLALVARLPPAHNTGSLREAPPFSIERCLLRQNTGALRGAGNARGDSALRFSAAMCALSALTRLGDADEVRVEESRVLQLLARPL